MDEHTTNQEKNELTEEQSFNELEALANFQIEPYNGMVDLEDTTRFTRLTISPWQKMQVSALLQQLPQTIAAGTLASAYTVKFPAGLPHVLSKLKQGGFGSMVRANGHYAGHASFYPLTAQAAVLGAFTVMSAVTGQYFLTQINSELNLVNQKLDEILGFLYGEKKAELLAEISFVKYAHSNFSTIMMHKDQRTATLASLQAAKKVAMKDIEFYLSDLAATADKKTTNYAGLCSTIDKALHTKDSIEMSRQLYVISGLLEIYYSQNYEDQYISYIQDDMISYVNKCDSRILSSLSTLRGKITDYREKRNETEDKEARIMELQSQITPYEDGNDSPIRTAMERSIEAIHAKAEYYIDKSGDVYVKRKITDSDGVSG